VTDDTDDADDERPQIEPPTDDDRSELGGETDDERPELPGETDDGRSGPLGNLASRVDERRQTEADEEFDDLFEEEDAGAVDREALWEQVHTDDPFDVESEAAEEPERRVVETDKYCESCRFFSEPPDVACTHPETEILEVLDMDHFEVFNCPVVRENENLQQL
jgi:hypothetical protein